jgi:hypothetical protein
MGDAMVVASDKALRLLGDDKVDPDSMKKRDSDYRSSLLAKIRPNMAKISALASFTKNFGRPSTPSRVSAPKANK